MLDNKTDTTKPTHRFIPARRLVVGFAIIGCLTLLLIALAHLGFGPEASQWNTGAALAAIGLVTVAALDLYRLHRLPGVAVQRVLPVSLSLNRWTTVTLEFSHVFQNPCNIQCFDGMPPQSLFSHTSQDIALKPHHQSEQEYQLRPLQRGPLQFTQCFLRVPSALGLWSKQTCLPLHTQVKVYPDFTSIAGYSLLATTHHFSQLGLRQKNRRGQGLDFHQLREYRRDDPLKQVNWKASARRQKLISKEYQDERDQNVVLLIDSGRSMRTRDDELDHFDHALNSVLLISHLALRQGDSVGVMSFGNNDRWIPPQKGVPRLNVILNGLYDLQAGLRAPDYTAAAQKLIRLQPKRSLVVLLTNSRDEEVDELLMATKLLQKRHLVIIANIREAALDYALMHPVHSLEDALRYSATATYLNKRAENQARVHAQGVYIIDCLAKELAVSLANTYWEIKRAGIL